MERRVSGVRKCEVFLVAERDLGYSDGDLQAGKLRLARDVLRINGGVDGQK